MMLSTFSTMGALTIAEKVAVVPALLLMVGAFLTVGALLRMASLIQFVSRTVVTGYVQGSCGGVDHGQPGEEFGRVPV